MAFFDFFKRKPPAPRGRAPGPGPGPEPRPVSPLLDASPAEGADPVDGSESDANRDGPERREKHRRSARPGTRILVIDDSPTIVALLKRMLQQNQYEVLEAFDGEHGLEVARREVPDLIFLDIVLPGIDGFNCLRTLRRDPVTKDVPIIMISGNAQATEQFYVQRIGADDFMKKPFSRAEVFSRIEPLLDEGGVPRHIARTGARAGATAP